MGQNEVSVVEQNIRLALVHHKFQLAVREHQRRARDAVRHAVFDSSARLELTLGLELRQAQQNNESTCSTENEMFSFVLVTNLKTHFGSKEPTWHTSDMNSFKEEKHN